MNSPVAVGAVKVGAVVCGWESVVVPFVQARIPLMQGTSFGPCTALGVVRDGELIGGVVYNNHNGHDIQATYAFDSPKWCTPAVLRILFNYPFNQLGCVRMTALIGRKNKHARNMVERLGFTLEGVHRKAADGRQDIISYGLLKTECRWIKPKGHTKGSVNGQEAVQGSRAA